jgi:hypothetical protein
VEGHLQLYAKRPLLEMLPVLQELANTYTALRGARLGIEERDFLIATLERSEAALASHATSLTSTIEGAAGDINLLVGR